MAVNLHSTHYRFGNDDGTESGHTFKANEDTNISLIKDATFLLRFTVQETGGTAAANVDNQFQVSRNGGAFQDITTSSTICRAVAVGAFANGDNCTKRLSGTGTFEASGAGCTEDGLSGGNANDIAASGNSETECGLQLQSGDLANGDTLTFRLTSPDFTITNDVVPTITVLHNVTVNAGLGQLDLAGLAPTVTTTNNTLVTTGLGQPTLTGQSPTVELPQTVTPGVGAPILSGLSPVIDIAVAPGVGSAILTGFEPTVTIENNGTTASPGVGLLDLNGLAPTVQTPVSVPTGVGALDLNGFAPTVQLPQTVTPGVGALDLNGLAPVPGFTINTNVGNLTLNGQSPSIQLAANPSPGVGSLTLTGFAPTVTATTNVVVPGRGQVTLEGLAPVVTGSPELSGGTAPATTPVPIRIPGHQTRFPLRPHVLDAYLELHPEIFLESTPEYFFAGNAEVHVLEVQDLSSNPDISKGMSSEMEQDMIVLKSETVPFVDRRESMNSHLFSGSYRVECDIRKTTDPPKKIRDLLEEKLALQIAMDEEDDLG